LWKLAEVGEGDETKMGENWRREENSRQQYGEMQLQINYGAAESLQFCGSLAFFAFLSFLCENFINQAAHFAALPFWLTLPHFAPTNCLPKRAQSQTSGAQRGHLRACQQLALRALAQCKNSPIWAQLILFARRPIAIGD